MPTNRRTFFRHVAAAGAALAATRALAGTGTTLPTKAIAKDDDARAIYTCEMHPQVRQKKPGTCPICNMTLLRATR